jgi:hypothetical protein
MKEEESAYTDSISWEIAPEGICNKLKRNLENSYVDFKKNESNPLVGALLQSQDEKIDIYLIAKDPNEETYYGIIRVLGDSKRQIEGIPLSDIKAMKVEELPMRPFRAKAYIENGIKQYE